MNYDAVYDGRLMAAARKQDSASIFRLRISCKSSDKFQDDFRRKRILFWLEMKNFRYIFERRLYQMLLIIFLAKLPYNLVSVDEDPSRSGDTTVLQELYLKT